MKKYRVYFTNNVDCCTEINANSEQEAKESVSHFGYNDVDTQYVMKRLTNKVYW